MLIKIHIATLRVYPYNYQPVHENWKIFVLISLQNYVQLPNPG